MTECSTRLKSLLRKNITNLKAKRILITSTVSKLTGWKSIEIAITTKQTL